MRRNEGSSNPMCGRKQTEETKRKISERAKGRNVGSKNPMYGKQHTNKEKFRKYNNHPAINYEDFIVSKHGIKRYRMKCLLCDKDKGHRALDSIDLPCFECAMKNNKKYSDVQKRIRGAAKARLNCRLRRKKLGKSVGIHFKDFPFTLDDLMTHLEGLFKPGMTWDNYGDWHIDHIRPDSSFDYSSAKDDQFLKCWGLSNLQPLWKLENLKKGAKYEKSN